MAYSNAHEERYTHLRRFKCKKFLSGEERVAKRLVYSRFFGIHIGEPSANGVDGLLATIEDKRIEVSMHVASKAEALVQFTFQPRGGNSNPRVTNACDTSGRKPKNKGPTASKGKEGNKPDKPKPRPHLKAKVKHETLGGQGEPSGRFLQTRLRLHVSSCAAMLETVGEYLRG
jgi:hypothetical protein